MCFSIKDWKKVLCCRQNVHKATASARASPCAARTAPGKQRYPLLPAFRSPGTGVAWPGAVVAQVVVQTHKLRFGVSAGMADAWPPAKKEKKKIPPLPCCFVRTISVQQEEKEQPVARTLQLTASYLACFLLNFCCAVTLCQRDHLGFVEFIFFWITSPNKTLLFCLLIKIAGAWFETAWPASRSLTDRMQSCIVSHLSWGRSTDCLPECQNESFH